MIPTAMGSSERLQISIRSNDRVAFFISAIARSGMVLNREKGFLISLLIGKYSCHTASSSPRQFGVGNHRLTCGGGNRSPVIIISLYEHKASFLCYKSPASDGSPLKYKSQYTL